VGDGWWVEGGDGGREEGKIWGEKMDVLHRSKVGFPQIFFFFFYYFFLKRALTLRGATLARMDSGAPNRVMVSLRLWPV
jgi:hypothetical protein